MTDKIEVSATRFEGCQAPFYDQGEKLIVPVCMGGTAINGCSNAGECVPVLNERLGDPSSHVFVVTDEVTGLARDATSVPTRFLNTG